MVVCRMEINGIKKRKQKRQIYRIKVVEDEEEECCIGLQKKAWAGNKSTTLTVRGSHVQPGRTGNQEGSQN